ncbi:MAG: hypothetical protein MJ072_06710, partial [Clostridia bacterium]|nr:hypothetical protein [Clostridia bacterium]
MSGKSNFINTVILIAVTVGSLLAVVIPMQGYVLFSWKMLLSLPVFILLNVFFHEIAHIIAGKANGFYVYSFRFLCFKFLKDNGRLRCVLSGFGEQVGEAELLPKSSENLIPRYRKTVRAGIIANAVILLLAIASCFTWRWAVSIYGNAEWIYHLTAFGVPYTVYILLSNALPMTYDSVPNAGAVLYLLKREDDGMKVRISLFMAQAELYQGKSPAEINEKYYSVGAVKNQWITVAFRLADMRTYVNCIIAGAVDTYVANIRAVKENVFDEVEILPNT